MRQQLGGAGALVAGVDEAGRGPLAGPVVAAAVILVPGTVLDGVRDSKTLAPAKREILAERIRKQAVAWGIGRATPREIDRLNILWATMLAMQRAVEALACPPERVLVDGNRCPAVSCDVEAVIGGDRKVHAISAASILAKVTRDADMVVLDARFPGYGFARHKGYPTREHRQALGRLGPCPVHRKSFAPVRKILSARTVHGGPVDCDQHRV